MAKGQKAIVTKEVLSWARNLDEITFEEAAKSAGVKVDRLRSWEDGKDLPTVKQAKKLAKKYRIPFVYFYLNVPPKDLKLPRSTDYRTFKDVTLEEKKSRELHYILRDIMERRDVMIDLYQELEYDTTSFDYNISLDEEIGNISNYIREIIDLSYAKQIKFRNSRDAFNYYLEAFEELGILVFQAANVDPREMRGMSVYENIFPIIVVNRKDAINARIFTLFHELVHLLTRTPGICDDMSSFTEKESDDIEIFCNKVAAQALVPKKYLEQDTDLEYFKDNFIDDNLVLDIARNFAVSRAVIIGRLHELGNISLSIYLKKLRQYSYEYNKNKNRKEGGFRLPRGINIGSQMGKLYSRTVLSAYNQELITPITASGYLSGLRLQHFPTVEGWCYR
jgi:Zn-dependent peptidase ImmA (M78 family)/DNA-binding XRE family transcriptional regulator